MLACLAHLKACMAVMHHSHSPYQLKKSTPKNAKEQQPKEY